MNHTMATAAAAQRMMVGNPLIFGMTMAGIDGSMAPNDTPFVAYVTSPNMTSMFAIVEMNGCILNFAVKNPATVVKNVHKRTHMNSANTIRTPIGIPVKSNIYPNTEPVLIPWCMIIVAVVIPIPTIRPMERSVPVRRISPATPNARNMRGEACCRMFSTLLYVSSGVFFTTGVMAQSAIKISRMAM